MRVRKESRVKEKHTYRVFVSYFVVPISRKTLAQMLSLKQQQQSEPPCAVPCANRVHLYPVHRMPQGDHTAKGLCDWNAQQTVLHDRIVVQGLET